MEIWGLSSCDSTRAARKALAAAGREAAFTDLREPGMAAADRAALIAARGAEAVVNRASATWRGLEQAERARPLAELLAAHPALIKRPVIRADGVWHQGWTPAVRAALGV